MRVTVQVNWLAATLAVLLETDELVATELRATELTLLATLLEAAELLIAGVDEAGVAPSPKTDNSHSE